MLSHGKDDSQKEARQLQRGEVEQGKSEMTLVPLVTCDGTTVSLECCTDDSQLPSRGRRGRGHKTDLCVEKAALGTLDSGARNAAGLGSWDYLFSH